MNKVAKFFAVSLLSIFLAAMTCGFFASMALGWTVTP